MAVQKRLHLVFNSHRGMREYVKLHALFRLETRIVETFEATQGTQHECKHLEWLLTSLGDIECLVAEASYLCRRNCKLVAEKGDTPYIKPKKNSSMKAEGC